ncbi:MAG: hypothetical protein AAB289_17645 [Chloroflexota bacterium]
MVRKWVKWDYELRPGADLEGVVDRALAIAQSEPLPNALQRALQVVKEEKRQPLLNVVGFRP